jgi:anti-sigma regulatory factor (Ser/Thr protein kinase)
MVFESRDMSIPADARLLATVRTWADAAAAEFGFGADERYAVVLAVSEAVANAIQHGSGSRADEVRITLAPNGDELVCDVLDTGVFTASVPGTTAQDSESGRGLEIVALTMDTLELRRDGRGSLLRFSKRLV